MQANQVNHTALIKIDGVNSNKVRVRESYGAWANSRAGPQVGTREVTHLAALRWLRTSTGSSMVPRAGACMGRQSGGRGRLPAPQQQQRHAESSGTRMGSAAEGELTMAPKRLHHCDLQHLGVSVGVLRLPCAGHRDKPRRCRSNQWGNWQTRSLGGRLGLSAWAVLLGCGRFSSAERSSLDG